TGRPSFERDNLVSINGDGIGTRIRVERIGRPAGRIRSIAAKGPCARWTEIAINSHGLAHGHRTAGRRHRSAGPDSRIIPVAAALCTLTKRFTYKDCQ